MPTNNNKLKQPIVILFITSSFIISVIAFDIIGVIVISIKNLLFLSNKSMLFLAYPIWFVVAVFNAAVYTSFATDQIKKNEALLNKPWLIGIIAAIIFFFAIKIFSYYGQMGNDKFDYYVPGHAGLTYTFFITLIISTFFFTSISKKK
jgi:hypothetical protein